MLGLIQDFLLGGGKYISICIEDFFVGGKVRKHNDCMYIIKTIIYSYDECE